MLKNNSRSDSYVSEGERFFGLVPRFRFTQAQRIYEGLGLERKGRAFIATGHRMVDAIRLVGSEEQYVIRISDNLLATDVLDEDSRAREHHLMCSIMFLAAQTKC